MARGRWTPKLCLQPQDIYKLTDEVEKLKLRGRFTDARMWAIIKVGLGSGLRVSELAKLQHKDLKLYGWRAAIFVRCGKGGKSRTVYVSDQTKAVIEEYIAWKQKRKLGVDSNDYFFTVQSGKQVSKKSIQDAYHDFTERIGIAKTAIHCLRHTFASFLLVGGAEIIFVQEQMGHADLETTRAYLTVIDFRIDQALDRMDEVYNGKIELSINPQMAELIKKITAEVRKEVQKEIILQFNNQAKQELAIA